MSPASDKPLTAAALYAAARFRRNVLTLQELRELIDAMMYQDIWYEEFLFVLDPPLRWPDGVSPAVEKLLEHFGLPMPDVDEANRIIIGWLLRPIAEGRIAPIDGLNDFMSRFFRDYELPATDKVMGESIGVSNLVGLYYSLDDWRCYKPDFLSDPAHANDVSRLKTAIVHAAQAWLEQHPQLTAAARTCE